MRFKVTHWHPPTARKPARMRGLGDLVAKLAEPVKRTILRHGPPSIRRALERCKCKERKEILNRAFPF